MEGKGVLRALMAAAAAAAVGSGAALLGTCGPFTDTAGDAFCPFVLEIFTLGITTGTTPTTYDPASNVSRLQMAAFLSRTVDRTLQRGNARAAMKRFWTPRVLPTLGVATLPLTPHLIEFDGGDLWVTQVGGLVSRVRSSDGKVLETWTGAGLAQGLVAADSGIFVAAYTDPGRLYRIDPGQPPGAATLVASNLIPAASYVTFDGGRFWVSGGSVNAISIVTPAAAIPWTATTVTLPGLTTGILYDGGNVWVEDGLNGTLLKLDGAGAVLQTVTVGVNPEIPVFDGTNFWVPNQFSGNTVTVVRSSNGAVLATLTGNGLNNPFHAAFDGERVLVTNFSGSSVSLWKAADARPIGFFSVGGSPYGACSDGAGFWITDLGGARLLRF